MYANEPESANLKLSYRHLPASFESSSYVLDLMFKEKKIKKNKKSELALFFSTNNLLKDEFNE